MSERRRPGWFGVALGTALGFLCGVVLIVVLGGVVHDIHHTRTVTRTVQARAPVEPGTVALPDFVGMELDTVESRLSDLGLTDDVRGGGTFGVIDSSNWDVVRQTPHAGTPVQAGSIIKLDIERN